MPGLYYAAVEGDPLTSGEGSLVYAKENVGTIEDESGRPRRMVFIGDSAYCSKCNSSGVVTYGAGVSSMHRMIDMVNGGRSQAVGGDIVLCKCADHPRITAVYGRSWMIQDQGEGARLAATQAPVQNLAYDERFTLNDYEGNPLRSVRYRIRNGPTVLVSGVTDSSGRTQRIVTNGSKALLLEVAH